MAEANESIREKEERERAGYLRQPQDMEEILLWEAEVTWLDDEPAAWDERTATEPG